MANNKASSRGKRDEMYSLDRLIVSVHHSAAGTAWRWRTELIVLAVLVVSFAWLNRQLHALWAGLVLLAFLGLVFGLPWSRRFTVARFWCVLSRHRFQRLCWEARLHTRAGRLPVILWARPTKVGERLFVWCRAGIAAEDFEQHTGELRAACYARDARVTRNTRWSQVVTIDVIRRDTLAATHAPDSLFKQLLTEHARTAAAVPALVGADDTEESGPPPWPEATITAPD
jgi:hypothetical protein